MFRSHGISRQNMIVESVTAAITFGGRKRNYYSLDVKRQSTRGYVRVWNAMMRAPFDTA